MHVEVEAKQLQAGLSAVVGAVERRTTLPILSFVLVTAEPGRLTLSATDLTVQVRVEVPAEVRVSGSIALPARKLHDLVRGTPNPSAVVHLKTTQAGKLSMTAGTGRYVLATLPAEDYPSFDEAAEETRVRLAADGLRTALSTTLKVCDPSNSALALTGVCLDLKAGDVVCVASDAKRMATYGVQGDLESPLRRQVLIPAKGVAELMRVLSSAGEAVDVSLGQSTLRVTVGATQLVVKLVDARFPAYEAIIPTSAPGRARLGRELLMSAIQRANIVADDLHRTIRFRMDPGAIHLEAGRGDQASDETVDAEVSMPGTRLALNGGFVLEALQTLAGPEVEVLYTDATTPILIRDPAVTAIRHVVTPIRS